MFSLRDPARAAALRQILRECALLLCVGSVMALNSAAGAVVRYVAADGSDQAAGDAEAPFRTIAKALSVAQPGDTIHIRAGIHTEHVRAKVSGTADQPIVIEGERGQDGQWLTVIDTSVPIDIKWVPAPEVGNGAYKARYPGFEPHQMLVDGRFIPRIWDDHMADGLGFKKLAYPPDQIELTTGWKGRVKFWDTVGAMFGFKDGWVYLRFRNREDPNTQDLRAAPAGGGLHMEECRHLIVRDLMVRGGEHCVMITGKRASQNVVERCRLLNGSKRLSIENGASHNIVRDNEMTIEFYAQTCRTGAWECRGRGKDMPYEYALKEHFYNQYKHFLGPNSTSDYGVCIRRAGPGNEISNNLIHRGGQGIQVSGTPDATVHHNTVYAFSSIGLICTMRETRNVRFYDNLVYDCNINLRIHHVNAPRQTAPRSLYVYRNRFYEKPDVGVHVFFHYYAKNDRPDYLHPDIYLYHNTFVGGRAGLYPSGYADDCGGLPKCVVVNNVFSTTVGIFAPITFIAQKGAFATVDYNWFGGRFKTRDAGHNFTKAPWYGRRNAFVRDAKMWDESRLPDFVLPAKSAARSAGLDLSKPCRLNGRSYKALPGMIPGYFSGKAPHLGALQEKGAPDKAGADTHEQWTGPSIGRTAISRSRLLVYRHP